MALLDNIAAYWKLDEASGTRVDATSRGNDLTEASSPSSAAGIIANAVSVSGGARVTRASTADLSIGAGVQFTLVAWLYLHTKGANRQAISKNAGATVGTVEYGLLYANAADRLAATASNGTALVTVNATNFGSPPVDTFLFVAMGWDGTNVYISINDGTANSSALTGGVQGIGNAFAIGSRSDAGAQPWDGRVDEVGLWKRTLTASEITFLYNSGVGRTFPFSAGMFFRRNVTGRGIAA